MRSKSIGMLQNMMNVATTQKTLDMISLAKKVLLAKTTKMEKAISSLFVSLIHQKQMSTLQRPKAKTVGIQIISDTGLIVLMVFTVNNKRLHLALAVIISVLSMTKKQILDMKATSVRPGMRKLEHITQIVPRVLSVKHRMTWHQPLAAI